MNLDVNQAHCETQHEAVNMIEWSDYYSDEGILMVVLCESKVKGITTDEECWDCPNMIFCDIGLALFESV